MAKSGDWIVMKHNLYLLHSAVVSESRPRVLPLPKIEIHAANPKMTSGHTLEFTLTIRISIVKVISMDFTLPKEEIEDRFYEVPSLNVYSIGDDEGMDCDLLTEGGVRVKHRVLDVNEERQPYEFISSKPRDVPTKSLFFSLLYYQPIV